MSVANEGGKDLEAHLDTKLDSPKQKAIYLLHFFHARSFLFFYLVRLDKESQYFVAGAFYYRRTIIYMISSFERFLTFFFFAFKTC